MHFYIWIFSFLVKIKKKKKSLHREKKQKKSISEQNHKNGIPWNSLYTICQIFSVQNFLKIQNIGIPDIFMTFNFL